MNEIIIREILSSLGYSLKDERKHFRTNAVYRGGDNKTSLCIDKKTGQYIDWAANNSGSFKELIALTLGFSGSNKELNSFLESKGYDPKNFVSSFKSENIVQRKRVSGEKIYDEKMLLKLLPKYDLLLNRNISTQTIKKFKCGLATSGKLNNRIVFPIYNKAKKIIGFTGRWFKNIPPENISKYKHEGKTYEWIWPAHIPEIDFLEAFNENKEVILVESPMCVLALHEVGIKNVLCLFSTKISSKLICYLIEISPKKIFISTNNEKSKVGNLASKKIQKKLWKFFDKKTVEIKLPFNKDFSEMLEREKSGKKIIEWYNQ